MPKYLPPGSYSPSRPLKIFLAAAQTGGSIAIGVLLGFGLSRGIPQVAFLILLAFLIAWFGFVGYIQDHLTWAADADKEYAQGVRTDRINTWLSERLSDLEDYQVGPNVRRNRLRVSRMYKRAHH